MLTIYTLSNCDTCRTATKWLREQKIAFEERPIRETPPTVPELKSALAAHDGAIGKLFNTAGRDYRALGLSEKLPGMSTADAVGLLSSNGNLVKRPFLVGDGVALAGFNVDRWRAALTR